MNFNHIWILRGANRWAGVPVAEAELDLGGWNNICPGQILEHRDDLTAWLPETEKNFLCHAPNLALVVQHLTLHLQSLAGSPVRFGRVQTTPQMSIYRVVVEYEEELLVRACLNVARDFCLAAVEERPYSLSDKLHELRNLAHEVRLGPSTIAIVRAARQRGIPTRRLHTASLVQLGWGAAQRRIWTAETSKTSILGEMIAQDKQLTRRLLQIAGVPVPQGRPVTDAEDAWQCAEEVGPPIVLKPRYGNQGRGVAANLASREQVIRAYAAVQVESKDIVAEKFVTGQDFRLLVVGDRVVAASRREPAQVLGDGYSTIARLVEETNRDPRRSDGHATALSLIKLDTIGLAVLSEQGYTPESIPAVGERVLIRRNANLSTGGTATDVTDEVHPEIAARAVAAARAVGLDVAGVDVVAIHINRPLEEQGGAILEVNAGPGLRMHLEPTSGMPRDVGGAIVDSLFPAGEKGRIPLVAVTGVNGKTTTTRLIAHLLRAAGRFVGMACTDGIYLDGRRTVARDCGDPQSARMILLNPRVETAVLETARHGILREGLGFDSCTVAVVTNIGSGDHQNSGGFEKSEELAQVKQTVVEAVSPRGAAILNAADPLVAPMAERCPGKTVFFAGSADQPVLAAHRSSGGKAVFARDGWIYLASGADKEEPLIGLETIPLTRKGRIAFQVENVLAATAAAWALSIPLEAICSGLQSFAESAEDTPGRFNIFPLGDSAVIIDNAQNSSAVAAVVAALDSFEQRRRTLVFRGCNCRDNDVLAMGEIVGDGFDRVVVYKDQGSHFCQANGGLNTCFREGLAHGKRVTEIVEVGTERGAIEIALHTMRRGELVVVGVDSVEKSLSFIQSQLRHLPARDHGISGIGRPREIMHSRDKAIPSSQ